MNKQDLEEFLLEKYNEQEDFYLDLTDKINLDTREVCQLLIDILYNNFEIKEKK